MKALVLILQFSSKFKIDQNKTFLKAVNKIMLKIDHWSKGTSLEIDYCSKGTSLKIDHCSKGTYFYLVVTPIKKKKSEIKITKINEFTSFCSLFLYLSIFYCS